MAKKNDEMSVAERLIQLRKEADELQSLVAQELEDELNAVLTKFDELEVPFPKSLVDRVMDQYQPPAPMNRQAPVRTRAASAGEKVQRVCKICGKPGHNARTCPSRPELLNPPAEQLGDPKLVKAEASA